MTLIRPTGIFVPVWALCHSLYAKQAKLGKPDNGIRRLDILDGSWKAPELKEWKTLDNMIRRGDKLLGESMPEWQIASAALEMLDANTTTPWTAGKEGEIEAHLGIVTNPFSRIYAGAEMYAVSWGELVLSVPNSRAQRSSSNFGETPRVHLIFTLAREEAQE